MPCYQTNRLIYERLQIRPEIFAKAVEGIRKELLKINIDVGYMEGDNFFRVFTGLGKYKLNLKTGKVSFKQGMEPIHNLVKRNYSMAAVQSVAAKSSIFKTFKATKVNERKLTLARR